MGVRVNVNPRFRETKDHFRDIYGERFINIWVYTLVRPDAINSDHEMRLIEEKMCIRPECKIKEVGTPFFVIVKPRIF